MKRYSVSYDDSVMHAALSVYVPGYGKRSDTTAMEWAPAASGIGSRIEWRMANGQPFAAIVGRWRRLEDKTLSSSTIEELLVVKITANLSRCFDCEQRSPSARKRFAFARQGPCVPSCSALGHRMLFIRFTIRAVKAAPTSGHFKAAYIAIGATIQTKSRDRSRN